MGGTKTMTRTGLNQSDEVYRRLEEQIVTLVIAPGRVVTEQELVTATGFGRTPVREAVQRLERDMLVQILPRRGILIEPIDIPRALMTLDVRARLEPMIMERAARLSSDIERMRFSRIAEQIEASIANGDAKSFTRLDRVFNDLAMAAGQHEVAVRVVLPLHAISRRIGFCHAVRHPDHSDASPLTHARLARALADNDIATVNDAMAHLFEIGRTVALELADDDLTVPPQQPSSTVQRNPS